MSSSIDRMITSDLAALDTDSRRDVPAAREAGIYRDGHAGAQARRDALAEEHRVQLAVMPLAIAQVFAHRIGRAAAGAAAIACSLAIVLLLADPFLMRIVQFVLPGFGVNILGCMTVAAVAILVTYVIATWIAEAWFARRMREAVSTRADVYADLDRLSQAPIDVAQRLVRRIDGWTTGLWLAGVASAVTVFGYLMVITAALIRPIAYMMSTTSVFAEHAAAENLSAVVLALAIAGGAAFVVGRACDREHRLGTVPRLLERLTHAWTLGGGALLGGGTLFATNRMFAHLAAYRLPSDGQRYGLAIGAELALLAVAAWAVLWWRARERKRLGE